MQVKEVPEVTHSAIKPLTYKNVLAAVDIGGSENQMLTYLSFWSRFVPLQFVQCLHVVPETTFLAGLFEKDLKQLPSHPSLTQQVESLLQNIVREHFRDRKEIELTYQVSEGDPLDILLEASHKANADLLVIGQRHGKSHQGILAKKLVRKSTCDTLIVPDSAPNTIRQILVPIDFSSHSGRALQRAIALANRLDNEAEISTLYVYSIPNMSAYQIDRTFEEYRSILLENLHDAQDAFLNKYVPQDKDRIHTELVEKDMPGTARYLKQFAEQANTDFVIMGAKGHSKVDRLLLGSVTEAFLMINDNIPTLITR